MNPFVEQVTNWVTNPASWFAPGPVAQMVGVLLVFFSILQSLPNTWAGGAIFSRKWAWITYVVTSAYVLIIFVIPFVGWKIGIALVIVILLLLAAIKAKDKWK